MIIFDHINIQFIKFNGIDQGMKWKADPLYVEKVDKYLEIN